MVGDDDRDLTIQLTGTGSVQQIGDAMQILRTEKSDTRPFAGAMQLPAHLQLFGERREGLEEGSRAVECGVERPLDAHEEKAELVVLVLIGVQDVCALLIEQAGDARYEAFAVWAVDEQDGAGWVTWFLLNVKHPLQIT